MHTTKLLIGLTLVASMANAQATKKKGTLVAQNDAAATTVAQSEMGVTTAPAMSASPATQTSVADAAAAKPVSTKKVGMSLAYETTTKVTDLKENKEAALIDGVGAIGITYKATDKIKTELRHNFAAPIISDRAQIAKSGAEGSENPYLLLDTTVHANVSTEVSVLGAKPLTISSRYYLPVSEASRAAGSNGTFRTQTSLDWDLNPKVTLTAAAQARLTTYNGLGENSDSRLRLLPQLAATYNFSDAFNAYYSPYMDLVTTGHDRGNFSTADVRNHLWQEIGLNLTVASVTINPAWATKGDAAGSDKYEGIGSDTASEYYLNVYASF